MKDTSRFRVGDKVIMKPPLRSSSCGYREITGKVLTIKAILPQYGDAFETEECGDALLRLRDIAEICDSAYNQESEPRIQR
jgi:hypothetical protein